MKVQNEVEGGYAVRNQMNGKVGINEFTSLSSYS